MTFMKLMKAMATVAGFTGLSRIAGFARDILTASILGAGPVADAFFVALKLPNFFRRVTAEGAFSVSFIPLYSETLEKDGADAAARFAGHALAIMFWGLLAVSALIILLMPFVIFGIAPGFDTDGPRYDLAVELSRITFPYLLLMSMGALLGGVMNAHEKFAPFAFAPVLFNLSLIGALLLADHFETAGHALAWGVLVSGFLQLFFLLYCMRRAGIKIAIRKPRLTPRMKKLFRLMGPGVLGAGVMHINLFADVIIASLLKPGAISYLYYADRLYQLPLGLIGIAVGTALLPLLSKDIAAERNDDARHLFNRAMEVCLVLGLPASVGLIMLAQPVIVTLFQHGAFAMGDAVMTAAVLTAYTIGMPAFIGVKVYSTGFWARQDTMTPVKISIVTTIVNICLSLFLVLIMDMGVAGIGYGTACAGWLQVMLLAYVLRRQGDGATFTMFDDRLKRTMKAVLIACALMAAFLFFARDIYDADADALMRILKLGALVGGGAAVYGVVLFASGVIKPRDLKILLTRPKQFKKR